jgi:hypothetical protein
MYTHLVLWYFAFPVIRGGGGVGDCKEGAMNPWDLSCWWLDPHRVSSSFSFFRFDELLPFGFLPRAILMTEWSALVISSGRAEHQQPPTQDPPTPPALSFAKTWRKREKGPILVFGWPIELLNISPPLLYMFFFSFLSSQGFSCLLFPRSYIDCVVQTSLIAGWKRRRLYIKISYVFGYIFSLLVYTQY